MGLWTQQRLECLRLLRMVPADSYQQSRDFRHMAANTTFCCVLRELENGFFFRRAFQ